MLRWIGGPCQRSIRIRRTILFSLMTFVITTSLLYAVIEHYTIKDSFIPSSSSSISSFELTCQLNNDTSRAIDLASTDSCKERLKEISCEINSKKDFFPRTLPRLCPIQSRIESKRNLLSNFLTLDGHFGDMISCRTSHDSTTHSTNNLLNFDSHILCIDHCLKLSVSFAGKERILFENSKRNSFV